ncbi:heterokaryon incompatibility protein-domain-containing protein [Scleroderma yunnanense]
MRLINVKALLDFENEILSQDATLMVDIYGADLAAIEYAILSHCWGAPAEEVQFKEMQELVSMDKTKCKKIRQRTGYQKILKSCEQTLKDKLDWVWVDTCCINKESSAELSEAINSMFRWYEGSKRCYAYLHDFNDAVFPMDKDEERYGEFNGWPKWFTRGWTLQELIAPIYVQFFNQNWDCIGDKRNLASTLTEVTRVPKDVLENGLSSRRPSVAQVMSWAADRKTTREEDRAYSLLGLLGVYMPMLYGEGKNAFQRLQLETIRKSNDHSIFAWDPYGAIGRIGSVLADDPSFFRDCQGIVRMDPEEFILRLQEEPVFTEKEMHKVPQNRFLAFSVTNGGIKIWLPVTPYCGSPSVLKAWLACTDSLSPMSIDLALSKSNYYRYFGVVGIPSVFPEFRQLHLAYQDEPAMRRDFTFKLDHRTIPVYGFAFCGTFPGEATLTVDRVKMSGINGRAVVVYSNNKANVRFAVALGHCFGQPWVHVVCDEFRDAETWPAWHDYAQKIYDEVWTAPEHAQCMITENGSMLSSIFPFQVHCTHIPRSIWDTKVIYDASLRKLNSCTVIVDVIQCCGCCGPPMWETLYEIIETDFKMPGLLKRVSMNVTNTIDRHSLLVDQIDTEFLRAPTCPGIKLGDYGSCQTDRNFQYEGNIFEDLKSPIIRSYVCIDPADSALLPVEYKVHKSSSENVDGDPVITICRTNNDTSGVPRLALFQPVCLALPDNCYSVSLLKALSVHLTDRYLVTMVVQCTEFHEMDSFREQIRLEGPQYGEHW